MFILRITDVDTLFLCKYLEFYQVLITAKFFDFNSLLKVETWLVKSYCKLAEIYFGVIFLAYGGSLVKHRYQRAVAKLNCDFQETTVLIYFVHSRISLFIILFRLIHEVLVRFLNYIF